MENKVEARDYNLIVALAAELWDLPPYQFAIYVKQCPKLKASLLRFDVAFYQNRVAALRSMTKEPKLLEGAIRMRAEISGLTPEEWTKMCEKLEDMCFR